MDEVIRLLIADDHTLFREGLVALFDSMPEIEVLATLEDGPQVIEAANRLQPDIILMDIQMPKINGIEATRQIIRENPHIGIIVVTMFEDDDSVFAAMRAGARGYILKGADQQEMLRAIQAVARGEAIRRVHDPAGCGSRRPAQRGPAQHSGRQLVRHDQLYQLPVPGRPQGRGADGT